MPIADPSLAACPTRLRQRGWLLHDYHVVVPLTQDNKSKEQLLEPHRFTGS